MSTDGHGRTRMQAGQSPALPGLRRRHRSVALAGVTILALLGGAAAGQQAPEWPAGGRFRVKVEARDRAAAYDLFLTHHGWAWTDGRDMVVCGPDQQPVSHFVSFADGERVRVLFDGQPGPGTYAVYFGNPDPKLPPVPPSGLVARGRADWAPQGGYTCITYKSGQHQHHWKPQLLNSEQVLRGFAGIKATAEAAQAKLDQQPASKEKEKIVPFVIRNRYPCTNVNLPGDPGEMVPGPNGQPVRVDGRFVHVFSGLVDLPESGDCHFLVECGDAGGELKTLFVDGDAARPVTKGWYRESYGYTVTSGSGSVNLAAGRHRFELYTFVIRPDIRVRFGSPEAPLETLDGRFATFEQTAKVSAGPPEVAAGTVAEASLEFAQAWLNQGQYARVRRFAQQAPALFAGQAEVLTKFAALDQAAREASSQQFWLMEGKVPERTGTIAGVTFGPPFRIEQQFTPRTYHDLAVLGGAVWTETGLVYGLPFCVFPDAWVITSGSCFADGILYVGLRNGRMIAVDYARAKLKWSFPGEGSCCGSPLRYRDTLYYGSLDRRLYALDAETGRMRWNFPTRGWIEGSPAATGETVFFGSADGAVYAVDAALGVERWNAKLDGPITGTPACVEGRIFIGTQNGTFYALASADGKVLWSYKAAGDINGGSCVSDGRVAFGDGAGLVHGLDTATGKLAWAQPCQVGGPVTAAPIAVGGVIYGGTADGKCYWGVNSADGKLVWTHPVVQGGDVHRPPLYANGRLVFVSRMYSCPQRLAPGAVAVFVVDPPKAGK